MDISKTSLIPDLVKAYLSKDSSVCELFGGEHDLNRAVLQLPDKNISKEKREVLVSALKRQYKQSGIEYDKKVFGNIELLGEENTYTVTTGQQIHLMLGPVYVAFKILTCAGFCKKLSALVPDKNFVPVFWMATEDHDLEEINHLNFFNRKFNWETSQTGACGRMSTKGIPELINEILTEFRFDKEDSILFEEIKSIYENASNLADASRKVTHLLFKDYGVVCIDGDDRELKKQFIPEIKSELTEGFSGKVILEKEIKNIGFKPQVSGRDTNLFYLKENTRERIDRIGNKFILSVSGKRYSIDEMVAESENYPERFSPNVVLRPLYQEVILPNLIYVAGPSEMVYWSQLKPVFNHVKIQFPVVMLRQMGIIAGDKVIKKMSNYDLEITDWMQNEDEFKNIVMEKLFNLNAITLFESDLDLLSNSINDYIYTIKPEKVKEIKKLIKGWQNEFRKFTEELTNDIISKQSEQLSQIYKLRNNIYHNEIPTERIKYWLEMSSVKRNEISEQISDTKSYPLLLV